MGLSRTLGTFAAGLGVGWWASRGGVARAHAEGYRAEGGAREPSSASSPPPAAVADDAAAADDAFRPSTLSLRELRDIQRGFARERDWDQYHTPRNLALAMVGEVGELCECFQWKGEVQPGLPGFSDREKEHVGACARLRSRFRDCSRLSLSRGCRRLLCSPSARAAPLPTARPPLTASALSSSLTARHAAAAGEEMSDVLLYLVRLADRCGVDLGAAVLRKVRLNAAKYPAALVHGSSKKYTEYAVVTTSQEQGAGVAAARADGAAS